MRQRMTQRLFFLVTIPAMFCAASSAQDVPESVPRESIADLISALRNANPSPPIDKSRRGGRALFPANYNWQAQTRVLDAWEELHNRFEEALPDLVEHTRDKDYCVTHESSSGAWRHMSVGECCRYIIKRNIEVYGQPRFADHSLVPRSFIYSFASENSQINGIESFELWWQERSDRPLAALQLEAVEWQMKQVRALADDDVAGEDRDLHREAKTRFLEALSKQRKQLKKKGHLVEAIECRTELDFDFMTEANFKILQKFEDGSR